MEDVSYNDWKVRAVFKNKPTEDKLKSFELADSVILCLMAGSDTYNWMLEQHEVES